MSLRYEQYRSLKEVKEFLNDISVGPRMPIKVLRDRARTCLHHFPMLYPNGQPAWSRDNFTKDFKEE